MIDFHFFSVLRMLKDFWLAYILISGQTGFPSQENPIVNWQVLSSYMNCKIYYWFVCMIVCIPMIPNVYLIWLTWNWQVGVVSTYVHIYIYRERVLLTHSWLYLKIPQFWWTSRDRTWHILPTKLPEHAGHHEIHTVLEVSPALGHEYPNLNFLKVGLRTWTMH